MGFPAAPLPLTFKESLKSRRGPEAVIEAENGLPFRKKAQDLATAEPQEALSALEADTERNICPGTYLQIFLLGPQLSPWHAKVKSIPIQEPPAVSSYPPPLSL